MLFQAQVGHMWRSLPAIGTLLGMSFFVSFGHSVIDTIGGSCCFMLLYGSVYMEVSQWLDQNCGCLRRCLCTLRFLCWLGLLTFFVGLTVGSLFPILTLVHFLDGLCSEGM